MLSSLSARSHGIPKQIDDALDDAKGNSERGLGSKLEASLLLRSRSPRLVKTIEIERVQREPASVGSLSQFLSMLAH